ncbi:MAG: hypothetical protein ACYTFZ_10280 [Planctomycetota bacterium]|jgi:hypothetical protein
MPEFRMRPGCGPHYMRNGRRVLPGDTVTCEPEELGAALGKFERLGPPPKPEMPRTGLKPVHIAGGWYDVVNPETGEPVNDQRLRKAEAHALAGIESESEPEPESEGPVGIG